MTAMTSLWLYFAFSMWCAWMAEKRSIWIIANTGEKQYIHRDRFFYFMLVMAMCLFVGLRIWCNDTGTYRGGYEMMSVDGSVFDGFSLKLASSFGCTFINHIIKKMGFSSQDYFMFYSFLTNGLYLWFARKYSKNFFLSVFFLWTMDVYLLSAAALRQAVAIAVGCVGVDRGIQKKWKAFVFWILMGSMLHPYAFLFGILPLLKFKPWTNKTWFLLAGTIVIGVFLKYFMTTILNITEMLGKSYDADEFSGKGVNFYRFLVIWAPIVLSFFVKDKMKENDDINNIFMNLSMVNAMIMFIALFGTANYFARLANYFLIFQTISVPWLISLFGQKNQRLLDKVVPACYLLYFYYANVVITNFNRYFAKMTLFDYIRSHF